MAEAGVDISGQVSKHLSEVFEERFDYVITVCDRARESCPLSLHAPNQLHWSFPDPAAASGPEEQQMAVFRNVRDQVRERIVEFLGLARMASDAVTS
jgi:arsenate reductase